MTQKPEDVPALIVLIEVIQYPCRNRASGFALRVDLSGELKPPQWVLMSQVYVHILFS